jgi:hypothetical protein
LPLPKAMRGANMCPALKTLVQQKLRRRRQLGAWKALCRLRACRAKHGGWQLPHRRPGARARHARGHRRHLAERYRRRCIRAIRVCMDASTPSIPLAIAQHIWIYGGAQRDTDGVIWRTVNDFPSRAATRGGVSPRAMVGTGPSQRRAAPVASPDEIQHALPPHHLSRTRA